MNSSSAESLRRGRGSPRASAKRSGRRNCGRRCRRLGRPPDLLPRLTRVSTRSRVRILPPAPANSTMSAPPARYLASDGGRPAPEPGGSSSPGGGWRFRLGADTFGRAADGAGNEVWSGRPEVGPSGAAGVPAIGGCGGVSGNGGGSTSGAGAVSRTAAFGGCRPAGATSQAMYGIPARCVHWHAASAPAAPIASGSATAAKRIGCPTSTPLRQCSGCFITTAGEGDGPRSAARSESRAFCGLVMREIAHERATA